MHEWIEQEGIDLDSIDAEIAVVREQPARALIERSRTADLVVIGARWRKGLARLRLISVSEQVARDAHCSVLIARPSRQR